MSQRLAFGWVLHQHQPVGNLPWVFAAIYTACYEPLLAALERHPTVTVTMHYTGPLLDWLIAHHPDYLERLAVLVERRQVEMMTGGYYEPILPILPEFDQIGQINKMTTLLQQRFGIEPQGMWIAERVWEPQLPSVLTRAGVRYTILDDAHFTMAGIAPDQMYNPYITEDQGHALLVYPNPQIMREIIPWKPLKLVESQLRELAAQFASAPQQHIVVMADDGEKFGAWPNTHERLWQRGGMDRFLELLERHSDWLETVALGEYAQRVTPQGRVYLPSAAYTEMMEWALPTERSIQLESLRVQAQRRGAVTELSFMWGGSWRNFAAKYPESNNFHKKMLRVHHKVREAAAHLGPDRTHAAFDQLWQGQCNCGYWHGAFGGIYITDIRSAIYQHLIQAEVIADSATPTSGQTVTVTDFDCDGREEILIEGPLMNIYLAPHDGGSIFEWDWKEQPFNITDTLARRPEPYHHKLLTHEVKIAAHASNGTESSLVEAGDGWGIVEAAQSESIHDRVLAKEAGLERLLHYDVARRTTLREHFFAATTTLAEFTANTYGELGDFVTGEYIPHVNSAGIDTVVVTLERDGTIQTDNGIGTVQVTKTLTLVQQQAAVQVEYRIRNTSTVAISVQFGCEGNWGMLGSQNPLAWYELDGVKPNELAGLDVAHAETQLTRIALRNVGQQVCVTIIPDRPSDVWRFPVETVSNSEAGFERGYQCSCTLLYWPLQLAPDDSWEVSLTIKLDH